MIKAIIYIVLLVLFIVGLGACVVYNGQAIIGKNKCIGDCMIEKGNYIEFNRIKYELAYWSCYNACPLKNNT